MSETMKLLVAYGGILGLSADDMKKIAEDANNATRDLSTAPPRESVLAASGECDPKILWLGAVVYGYMIDTCTTEYEEAGDVSP